ncbi:MAG: sigma-70 family RNA polymerase sigma factor [Chloroflexota bacterium]
MTLQTLLDRAQDDDTQAFAEIREQYEPRIRRFASRMIYNSVDVEDIVQNTFIAFYKNLSRITSSEHVRPFLFRVARNLSYDYLRDHYRQEQVTLDKCDYQLSDNLVSPEERVHWGMLLDHVRQAIDCLPDLQRETLILYVEEQLTQAEIASVMHTEIGTVKSRLHYARKILQQSLPPDILRPIRTSKKSSKV